MPKKKPIKVWTGLNTKVTYYGLPVAAKSLRIGVSARKVAKGMLTFYEVSDGRIVMRREPTRYDEPNRYAPVTHTVPVFLSMPKVVKGRLVVDAMVVAKDSRYMTRELSQAHALLKKQGAEELARRKKR